MTYRTCIYVSVCSAWYDVKSQNEFMNTKTFAKLNEAIGVVGLYGLDILFAHMIKNQLQNIQQILRNNQDKTVFCNLNTEMKDVDQVITKGQKTLLQLVEVLLLIGTFQIIRKHIAYQLNTSCKFDSAHLEASLRTLNE